MRPRLTTILLLLVLGAVVNVGVAIACAVWVDLGAVEPVKGHSGLLSGDVWIGQLRSRPGARDYLYAQGIKRYGPNPGVTAERFCPPWTDHESLPPRRIVDARGWPMLCVWCVLEKPRWSGPFVLHGGVELPLAPRFPGSRGMPIAHRPVIGFRPVLSGWVVNTLFYATLLWLPLGVRQVIRFRRRLCPACAYPVGESDVCTECGRAVRGGGA